MILSGYSDADLDRAVDVTVTIDTSDFVRAVVRAARSTLVFAVKLEVLNLNADQVSARFYVRGAMDPECASPAARDHYLRALCQVRGDRGHAAREGFLRGWFDFHTDTPAEPQPLAWHRLLGRTAISVGVTR